MSEINRDLDTTPLPPNNLVAQDPQSAELAGYVRTKTFGREVREAIARSIELNSTRSKSAEILANEMLQETNRIKEDTATATSNMANQVELIIAEKDAVIANATVDSEVILARGGKPTLQARLDETTAQLEQIKHKETTFVAHRGLNNAYPENTLLAFEMACLAGYKIIELDIQPTSDGHLVVHHDLTVDRMTNGTGTVTTKTLADIQALTIDGGVGATEYPNLKVPTLEEYLIVMRKYNVKPMIELKVINSYTQLDTLVALLVKYGFEYNSCIISSVTYLIDEFRKRGGKSEALLLSPITPENTALLKSYGNCGYCADYTVVTREVIDSVHAEGLSIGVYTVNDTAVARNLRKWGADYITTDAIKEVI